jgi:host factor-I protein
MPVFTIQESFFSAAHQGRKHVTVHLVNGGKVTGRVCCHDKYSVVLENQQEAQLVFKHSISAAFLCQSKECPECRGTAAIA